MRIIATYDGSCALGVVVVRRQELVLNKGLELRSLSDILSQNIINYNIMY